MRKLMLALLAAFVINVSAWAGTNSPARKAYESKNYQQVIDLVEKSDLKTAEDHYLIGQAYYLTGKKKTAHGHWVKAVQQDKDAGGKYSFLFKPGLKGTQKSAIYKEFKSTFKQLNAAVISGLKDTAKTSSRDAARTRVDASRADAVDRNLTRKADARSETINSLQKNKALNNKKKNVKKARTGITGTPALIIIGIIILLVVLFVVFGRRSDEPEVVFVEAPFGCHRYDVYGNDDHFMGGPFWYQGAYFHNSSDFHSHHGYYYTNNMYTDNYDTYGSGQGRDEALDRDIMQKIDEREDLRDDAADAGLDADNMRADAEDLDLDSSEAQEDIDELRETADILDDEPEFEDDEPEEEDDEPEEEDDEPEEEDDEPSFEDDEPEEEA